MRMYSRLWEFGRPKRNARWRKLIRRVSPWDSVRRFASCDLYPVYSWYLSRPPPGISRDVCGYLTRENNLRGYIVLAHCEMESDARPMSLSPWTATDIADRTNIEIALEWLSWDAWRRRNGWRERWSSFVCRQYSYVFFIFFVVSYFKNKYSFIRYNFEIIRLKSGTNW